MRGLGGRGVAWRLGGAWMEVSLGDVGMGGRGVVWRLGGAWMGERGNGKRNVWMGEREPAGDGALGLEGEGKRGERA
jgi:hypothetical protein